MTSQITVSCYENEVPPFVEQEVDRLYGNIFSSLLEFRVYGWTDGATSTYAMSHNGKIAVLLLFTRHRGRVRVLNEGIHLVPEDLAQFASFIFARYADVSVISFKAIQSNRQAIPFPYQCFNRLEDITLTLPATTEDYLAGLGKNTRRNIKRYTDRLVRRFPSFRFHAVETSAVDAHDIRTLVGFNHARMADKQIASSLDEAETSRIIELVKACGLVGIATIDDRVVAGAISYKAGSNYFLNVLAHDPAYDDYWIGFLCCYLTIRECIARQAREFHFLWGRYDYKFTLGGIRRDLDNLTVYRSHLQLLMNADIAAKEAVEGYWRKLKLWLKYEDAFLPHQVRHLLERLRERRSARTLKPGPAGEVSR